MKTYTFNDADRLTELVNQLKAWSALSNTAAASGTQAASM